jgi:radical SAM superfamily enzyme YgiQ (UPF0313 family)
MYRRKRFQIRSPEQVERDLQAAACADPGTRKVFFADGDPLVLSTEKLLDVLQKIPQYLPNVQRISAYASPRNLKSKSKEELDSLRQAGLSLLYVGIESGDDLVLERIKKGETAESMIVGLHKARLAGIRLSVMILLGLGGTAFSEIHAQSSAEVINRIQPEYLSTLVLGFPCGRERFQQTFGSDYRPLSLLGHLQEMRRFLSQLKLKRTIFRSDHVSNVLALRGNLSRDQWKLIAQIDGFALEVAAKEDLWEERFRTSQSGEYFG